MRFYLIVLLFSITSQAQINPKTKWGDISEEEIRYNQVPFEKDADAVILFETGSLMVAYEDWGNKIYRRIKILSEKGKEQANYDLIYFTLGGFESVINLKAQTINFENGKKIITPVKFKEIYDIPYSGYYRTKRFAFPNVKVGSIIELEYELVNNFHYYMEGWVFQHDIPTLYSSFSVDVQIPADYVPILSGEQIIAKAHETKNKKEYKTSWTLKDLPSLENIEFSYNPRDYEERIDFQLKGYYHKKGYYVNEVRTWNDIRMFFREAFLKQYDQKIVSNIAQRILTDADPQIQTRNILDYFRKNFHWDKSTNASPRQNFSALDLHRKGTSSELNLLLNHVLNKKGIYAKLILIGNRNHRKIQTAYPYFNQFSSVINHISFPDGTSFFIDASQIHNFAYQFMPLRNYNHFGLDMNADKEEFIVVSPPLSEFHSNQNFIWKDGKFSWTKIDKKSGFFIDEEIGEIFKLQNSLDIHFLEISQSDDLILENKFLSNKSQFQSETQNQSFYSFRNPLEQIIKKFQFKETKRKRPIEFDFPLYFKIVSSYKIPTGYDLSIPENFNAHHNLGENDLIYYQNANIQNETLVISIEFVIKKQISSENAYPEIKSFFDKINLDASKTILLKKN